MTETVANTFLKNPSKTCIMVAQRYEATMSWKKNRHRGEHDERVKIPTTLHLAASQIVQVHPCVTHHGRAPHHLVASDVVWNVEETENASRFLRAKTGVDLWIRAHVSLKCSSVPKAIVVSRMNVPTQTIQTMRWKRNQFPEVIKRKKPNQGSESAFTS